MYLNTEKLTNILSLQSLYCFITGNWLTNEQDKKLKQSYNKIHGFYSLNMCVCVYIYKYMLSQGLKGQNSLSRTPDALDS